MPSYLPSRDETEETFLRRRGARVTHPQYLFSTARRTKYRDYFQPGSGLAIIPFLRHVKEKRRLFGFAGPLSTIGLGNGRGVSRSFSYVYSHHPPHSRDAAQTLAHRAVSHRHQRPLSCIVWGKFSASCRRRDVPLLKQGLGKTVILLPHSHR